MGLFRILYRLIFFWKADQARRELQNDLRSTYQAQRARADHASQDYRLKRDLEALNRENNEN